VSTVYQYTQIVIFVFIWLLFHCLVKLYVTLQRNMASE